VVRTVVPDVLLAALRDGDSPAMVGGVLGHMKPRDLVVQMPVPNGVLAALRDGDLLVGGVLHHIVIRSSLLSTRKLSRNRVTCLVFKGPVYRTEKKDRNWTELDRLGPDQWSIYGPVFCSPVAGLSF
jgi:hypothetical protein